MLLSRRAVKSSDREVDFLKNLSVAKGRQLESSLLQEMQSRSVLRPPHTTRVSASKSETVWKYLPGRNSKMLKCGVLKMQIPKGRSGIEQSTSSSCSVSSSTVLKREPPFPPTMTKPVQCAAVIRQLLSLHICDISSQRHLLYL